MQEEAAAEHHPWRQLRHPVRFGRLEDGLLGAWDPDTGTIWLAHGLTQVERRCTLAHEQVHAERGDEPCITGWHDGKQERAVEEQAARRLIALAALIDAMLWTQDLAELADALWVDETTLRARLAGLTADEHQEIERRLYAAERWIA